MVYIISQKMLKDASGVIKSSKSKSKTISR